MTIVSLPNLPHYEDHGDGALAAATEDVARALPSLDGWAINARWADSEETVILLDLPSWVSMDAAEGMSLPATLERAAARGLVVAGQYISEGDLLGLGEDVVDEIRARLGRHGLRLESSDRGLEVLADD